MQRLRKNLIFLAFTATISWLYVAVLTGLELLPRESFPGELDPGLVLLLLLLPYYAATWLSLPLAVVTALLAVAERLLARRWAWRVLLPILAVAVMLPAAWILPISLISSPTNYDNLLVTMQQHVGWSNSSYYLAVYTGVAVAFALGAMLEWVFVFLLGRDTPMDLVLPGSAVASGRTD